MQQLAGVETYRFTVEEYHKLAEAGILGEDDRVELLNGNLVIMSPIGIRHVNAVRRMIRYFSKRFSDRCVIDAQNPTVIDPHSELQPDIMLLTLEFEDPLRKPEPPDVHLLVEAADSSLGYDGVDKRDAYARTGIAEYWILDLTVDELVVFREPAAGAYQSVRRLRAEEAIAPLAFPDLAVRVGDLLPRRA